ncbi:MAG: tetratricopeptide repeat protein [Desulfohalobiaceae bacterium]
MSLIYQSLKKLQSGEDGSDSPPGPHSQPDRTFCLRNAVWVLLGVGLLAAGAYGSWIAVGGDSPQSPSQRTAETKAVNHSAETTPSLPGTNASLAASSENRSADRSHVGNDTGSPPTEMRAPTSAQSDPPRLLRFFCRRNGTRARLGLEFDRKPQSPETHWDNTTKTLGLAFSSAQAKEPHSLRKQAARNELDLSLSSLDPLRLRLNCPDLEEYSAFTLPGSEGYGPRYILALRFSRNTQEQNSPGKQSGTSASSDSKANHEAAHMEQAEEEAEPREENRQPESAQEDPPGSLEVTSNTHEQQTQGLSEVGPNRIRRLLEQNRDHKAAQLLRESFRRDPDDIALRTRYADVLISEQRYRLALQVLQLDNSPNISDHSDYYARVAYARRKLGRHERAARVYRALARNEPREGRWWMGLGLCLENMERIEAALTAYERALGTTGLNGDVRAFLKQRTKKLDSGDKKH